MVVSFFLLLSQAHGRKLGIVYIAEAGGKVSAEMFSVTGFIYLLVFDLIKY